MFLRRKVYPNGLSHFWLIDFSLLNLTKEVQAMSLPSEYCLIIRETLLPWSLCWHKTLKTPTPKNTTKRRPRRLLRTPMLSEDCPFPQSFTPPRPGGRCSFSLVLDWSFRASFRSLSESLSPGHAALLSFFHPGLVIIHQSPEISLFLYCCRFLLLMTETTSWTHSSNILHLLGSLNNSTPTPTLHSRSGTLQVWSMFQFKSANDDSLWTELVPECKSTTWLCIGLPSWFFIRRG